MKFFRKGVLWPSFFMFVALVLGLVISIINGYVFWWLSVSILLLLALYYFDPRLIFNPLTIATLLFLSLLILNMVFVRPAYDQDASYLIVFFASGFLLFSFADKEFIKHAALILNGLFLLLALWGLVQYFTGYGYLLDVGSRANALFYTPNTYAACLNIILLPLVVIYLHNKRAGKLLPLVLILFAALLVSQSRGGWVALIVSTLFLFVLCRIVFVALDRTRMKKLIIGFILVFSTYALMELIDLNQNKNESGVALKSKANHIIRSGDVASTLEHRTMLRDIAWQQIKERPLLGYGFHTYQYFQIRDQRAPHIGNATRFVHNDYLQLWMETGIFGLIIFVSVPIIVIGMLLIIRSRLSAEDRVVILALSTGLIGFYVQALVDFLFYTPFLLMMYGIYLGYLNQLFNKYSQNLLHYKLLLPHTMIRPVVIKSLLGIFVICYLSQSAIAQLAFDQANRNKNRLDIKSALTGYELARRFAPYESSYYLVEGDIWYHAAKATGDIESARRSDTLFEKGAGVNPYEVTNLFWRAILHRDLPELLLSPVSSETVLSWLKHVLHWLPNDQQAQAEYIRTLSFMGQDIEAKQLLSMYLEKSPDSYYLTQVQSNLEVNAE